MLSNFSATPFISSTALPSHGPRNQLLKEWNSTQQLLAVANLNRTSKVIFKSPHLLLGIIVLPSDTLLPGKYIFFPFSILEGIIFCFRWNYLR